MKSFLSVGLLALATQLASAQSEECPELPDTGVNMGEPVPMKPEDIPKGCSDYEILVGMFPLPPDLAP